MDESPMHWRKILQKRFGAIENAAAEQEAPPAEILDHVPAYGGPVYEFENEDHRHRDLLLSSIGALAGLIAAGFIYTQRLFEEKEYKLDTLFSRPKFGRFIVEFTPEQKRVFCANTAHYVGAMRDKTELEVIIDEAGVKRFKPLSSSGSTGVTLTPSSSMKLHGNEVIIINDDGKLVYKGETEVLMPEDPYEISAFCMAEFFLKENVQTLLTWGEDFEMITEADLLSILSELRGGDWRERLIGALFENAYTVYNQTGLYLDFITAQSAEITRIIRDAPDDILNSYTVTTEFTIPYYREQTLNHLARNYPKIWAATNIINDNPISCAVIALVVLYHLRTPIGKVLHLCYRLINWFAGRNPDGPDALAIEDGPGGGGGVRRGGGKQPLSVIVINNPLPSVYLNKLKEIFDEDSIKLFVEYIDKNKVPLSRFKKLKKNAKKAIKSLKTSLKKSFKTLRGLSKRKDPTSVTAMELQGGKNKKSIKRKHKNKRKTYKR